MPSLQRILTLLFLLFNLVLAVPSERDGLSPRSMPEGNFILPGQPTGTCDIKYKWVTDSYVLHGYNWNITESELKHAVKDDTRGMTAWKFKEEYEGGVQAIMATVSLFSSSYWNFPIVSTIERTSVDACR